VHGEKAVQRAVVGSLHIIGKKASGKLSHLPVVLNTLTAESFAAARLISAIAPLAVGLKIVTLLLSHNRLLTHKCGFLKIGNKKGGYPPPSKITILTTHFPTFIL